MQLFHQLDALELQPPLIQIGLGVIARAVNAALPAVDERAHGRVVLAREAVDARGAAVHGEEDGRIGKGEAGEVQVLGSRGFLEEKEIIVK